MAWMKRVLGLVLLLPAAFYLSTALGVGGASPPSKGPHVAWVDDLEHAKSYAQESDRPIMVDFSAEWCLPCKELDHRTFVQPEVVDATSDIVTLRADLTESATPAVAAIRKQFAIKGVPTIVFLDKNGAERKDLRVFGFVDGDEFLERVNRLKKTDRARTLNQDTP